ncbi:MAG: heparinase II/III family protein [Pseudomonadota bacterium]
MTISFARAYRRAKKAVWTSLTAFTGHSIFIPEHLVIAPKDLHTADPSIAAEYYRGRYALGGHLVELGNISPFLAKSEDTNWQKALHEFSWLRHLSADGSSLSASHARAMISDWTTHSDNQSSNIVWGLEITSKRLISWLNHSILILHETDSEFHQEFMRCIGMQLRYLKRYSANSPAGRPRLLAYIALTYASICLSGQTEILNFASSCLEEELKEQFPEDGGHISRDPQFIIEILALLLPLRESFISLSMEPPSELGYAIERLYFALRFFRMGDGNLARFNGSGITESDLLATLFRYNDVDKTEPVNGSNSGYERIQMRSSILIMDCDRPPRGELSTLAHAGCLSFELSSENECLIVNAGTPVVANHGSQALWRTTAAHSTAVFSETSQCKFEYPGTNNSLLGNQIFSANLKSEKTRHETESEHTVTASHQGYVREFGARHERKIAMSDEGDLIVGNDWFTGPDKGELRYTTKDQVTIHFHLHPDIRVMKSTQENALVIETRSGQQWQFYCPEVEPTLEESIYFANLSGPRHSQQITLKLSALETHDIHWMLQKLS